MFLRNITPIKHYDLPQLLFAVLRDDDSSELQKYVYLTLNTLFVSSLKGLRLYKYFLPL